MGRGGFGALVFLVLIACGSESKVGSDGSDTAALAEGGTGKVQGKVWTVDGDPVVGAIVSVGARKTATNALGFFLLEDLPVGEAVISAEADGYSTTGAVRTLPEEGWGYVDLRLRPAEVLSWDPTEGGALETESGVELRLGALQDALGEEVSGPVSVSVSLLNTADDMAAAPGALMASQDGQDSLLETLGMVEVRLTDESGLQVQLAEPAEISFPVADVEDQEGFGLFGFDEKTGRWEEVGGGEVEDGRFQVEVEHFSWWSSTRIADTDQCVTGTLKAGGEVVAGATISVYEAESLSNGRFETDEDGRFIIDLPAGAEVQLSLDYGVYSWESELISLPDTAVSSDDRPSNCVDLGEVTARRSDDDGDGFAGEARGGPDCDDDDPDRNPSVAETWYDGIDSDCGGDDDYDQDGDGHRSDDFGGDDCVDMDLWIHPDRVDYCDGEDDNCSGDESDATDATIWYQDQDGDGYGTDASKTTSCSSPGADWVTEGGDCDDTEDGEVRFYPGAIEDCGAPVDYNCDGNVTTENEDGDDYPACADCDDGDPQIFPGADEICDGKDNDCDGSVDDDPVDEKTYYLDYDGDGFGEFSTAYTGCSVPSGYVEEIDTVADCNDEDSDSYPGAPELCDDSVVQDCEGSEDQAIEECVWSGEYSLDCADARLLGEAGGDNVGASISGAGDLNGDTMVDFILGAMGGALVFDGPVDDTIELSDATATLHTETEEDGGVQTVTGSGDIDGDEYSDLLLGVPERSASETSVGAAYLLLGPVSGELSLSEAEIRMVGAEAYEYAGESTAAAGDVNGDGLDDMLIGAPSNESGGVAAGLAYLVFGGSLTEELLSDTTVRLIGEQAWDEAATALAGAGDVDGDGLDDIVVGAPGNAASSDESGAAYVFLGPLTGAYSLVEADYKLAGMAAGDHTGSAVAGSGDTNGDGFDDILLGSPDADGDSSITGNAYLLTDLEEASESLGKATAILTGGIDDFSVGSSLSTAGDLDGNGLTDLLIGAPESYHAGSWSGAIYSLLSPVSGTISLDDADARFIGEGRKNYAGRAVAGAGDLSGDEVPDILVSAQDVDEHALIKGAVYLLFTSSF